MPLSFSLPLPVLCPKPDHPSLCSAGLLFLILWESALVRLLQEARCPCPAGSPLWCPHHCRPCLAPSQMWSLEGGDLVRGSGQPRCWAHRLPPWSVGQGAALGTCRLGGPGFLWDGGGRGQARSSVDVRAQGSKMAQRERCGQGTAESKYRLLRAPHAEGPRGCLRGQNWRHLLSGTLAPRWASCKCHLTVLPSCCQVSDDVVWKQKPLGVVDMAPHLARTARSWVPGELARPALAPAQCLLLRCSNTLLQEASDALTLTMVQGKDGDGARAAAAVGRRRRAFPLSRPRRFAKHLLLCAWPALSTGGAVSWTDTAPLSRGVAIAEVFTPHPCSHCGSVLPP